MSRSKPLKNETWKTESSVSGWHSNGRSLQPHADLFWNSRSKGSPTTGLATPDHGGLSSESNTRHGTLDIICAGMYPRAPRGNTKWLLI